jgi:uncharacterized alpha-E superfamily protein
VTTPLPQVDLAASVPTRAADALFWMGRSGERAGAIARTLRVVAGRRRQDPMLVTIDGGRWTSLATAALGAVCGQPVDEPVDGGTVADEPRRRGHVLELEAASVVATRQLGARLRSFVADAASVGEFLPGGTARVFTTLAALFESFAGGRAALDAIDNVLAALAGFAGMWSESTVRGPAWRFGDIGIRLERTLVVLGLGGSLIGDEERAGDAGATADVAALEVLLAANESLVAYRRQFRSDVAVVPALELLLRDGDNPRGFLACMHRVAEHVADVGWRRGEDAVRALAAMVTEATTADLATAAYLDTVASAVAAFADEVVETWFATPVKPMLMRAGRAAMP